MKKLVRRSLAIAGTAVFATTALWTTASPASAATYNGACGSGYSVLDSDNVGQLGTVFLTYNDSTGQNCVVTVDGREDVSGSATYLSVGPAMNMSAVNLFVQPVALGDLSALRFEREGEVLTQP